MRESELIGEALWELLTRGWMDREKFGQLLELYHRARVREAAEGPAAEPPAAEPETRREPEKVKPLARKKRAILSQLQSRRETGTGLQDVADASGGTVTMELLISALEARPLTVAEWEAIGKALKAAREAK